MKPGRTAQTLAPLAAPLAVGCALAAPTASAHARTLEGVRDIQPESAVKTADTLGRGKFLLKSGNVPLALEMFRRALVQDPNSVEALNGAAVCYDRLGAYEASRSYYEAALGIDPSSPMLLNNYGYSLFLQGDLEGAKRYLSLAAVSGDPDVETASLRILARVDAARARALPKAPEMQAEAQAPAGPVVVRTSSYEQRLVLTPAKAAPPPVLVAALGDVATQAVPIARMTDAEDAAIVAREFQLVAAEQQAARLAAQANLPHADDAPPVPTDMAAVLAGVEALGEGPAGADFRGFARAPVAPPTDLGLWLADYVMAPHPAARDRRRVTGRDGPLLTVLPSGLLVQRSASRPALTKTLPAAEPLARKRSFEAPFESDDGELNGFAARVHGADTDREADVAARVALLQDLIERLGAA
jgi:Flp pilus assembly protein TadD